jgi:glycosyltransferase involved in cell wall biosynthesis
MQNWQEHFICRLPLAPCRNWKKTVYTVVIITLNEEINIGRCLDSVKEIADEIIVVDSLSTDKTKDICLSYGVRFIEQPF